jgi:hypothetical protein
MTDWNPLIASLALFIGALAAAVPSFVVVWSHRAQGVKLDRNSKQLARIETNTNGNLQEMQEAIVSLRAEVVRQAAIIDAHHNIAGGRAGGDHGPLG